MWMRIRNAPRASTYTITRSLTLLENTSDMLAEATSVQYKLVIFGSLQYFLLTYIKIKRVANHRHKTPGKHEDTTPKRRDSPLNYLDQTQTMARKLGYEEEGGSHQEDVHGGCVHTSTFVLQAKDPS